MPADHDRSSTRALNRGNTGIGSDRKMNLAHSNTANLLTPAAVARKQTDSVRGNGGLSSPPSWGRLFWAVAIGYWTNYPSLKQLASKTQFNGVSRLRTYISFTHSAF